MQNKIEKILAAMLVGSSILLMAGFGQMTHAAQFIDVDLEGTKYHVLEVTKSDKLDGRFVWYDQVFSGPKIVSGKTITATTVKAYYTCRDEFLPLRIAVWNKGEKIFSYSFTQSELHWRRIPQEEEIVARQIQEYACSLQPSKKES